MFTPQSDSLSTRPYLVRAIYEWCSDNHFTPYVAVQVDETVQVPREHVRNGEIVLNIAFDATGNLQLGNEYISFKARFGGVSREIMVPINRVLAIYALENGQGMAFPVLPATASAGPSLVPSGARHAVQSASDSAPRSAAVPAASPSAGAKVLQLVPNPAKAAGKAVANEGSVTEQPAASSPGSGPDDDPDSPPPPPPQRPTLTRVK